jgi:superfamily I DNA/RNA helicase
MYNQQQLKVIQSEHEKIVVIAPPGSGKTHTMVGAIEYFINKYNTTKNVAITFTKKATEELKNRLFAIDSVLHIATIHSWSLLELQKLSKQYSFRVKLMQEEQIMIVLRPLMEEYDINPRSYRTCYYYIMGYINPDLPFYVKVKFEAIKVKYQKFKRKRFLYDFTDLPLYLKDKLEEYDEYITLDSLFVDEFQDVDPIQLEVFNRVISNKKFFIGDTDQAIYHFRGATKDIFNFLPNFNIYRLFINYRSYQPIIDFATAFKSQIILGGCIKNTEYLELRDIIAERGDGQNNCTIFLENRGKFDNILNNSLPIHYSIFVPFHLEKRPYQFLCRTNKEVKELQKAGISNVSTIHQAKGLEFENVWIIDFTIESEEDENIAYVALTRAKDKVVVSSLAVVIAGLKHVDMEKIKTHDLSNAF